MLSKTPIMDEFYWIFTENDIRKTIDNVSTLLIEVLLQIWTHHKIIWELKSQYDSKQVTRLACLLKEIQVNFGVGNNYVNGETRVYLY